MANNVNQHGIWNQQHSQPNPHPPLDHPMPQQVYPLHMGVAPVNYPTPPMNILRYSAIEKEAIFLGTCLLCQETKLRTFYDTQGRAYKLVKGETNFFALGICPQYSGTACIMFSDNSSCEVNIMNLHFSPEQTSKSFTFYFGPENKRYTLIWCAKNRLFRDVGDSSIFFYVDPCRSRVAQYLFK
jgi:hypothetical protein